MNNLMDNNENEDFDFSKYLTNNQNQNQQSNEDEGWLSTLLRGGVRSAKRAGEAILGSPGDLQSLLNMGIDYISPGTSDYIPKLPTSSDIREYTKTEYTEPKNDNEKFSDEIATDAALFFNPFSKAKTGVSLVKKFATSLGKSLFGNVGKEVVRNAGGSDIQQDATKLGLFFLTSLYDPKRIQRKYNELYKTVREELPATLENDIVKSGKQINNLRDKVKSGLINKDKQSLLNDLNQFEKKLSGKKIKTNDLFELKSDFNDRIVDRNIHPKLKRHYVEARQILDDAINSSLKNHPKQLKDFREANSLFSAEKQTRKAIDTIIQSLDRRDARDLIIVAKDIFGSSLPGLALGAGGVGLQRASNTLRRVNSNSSTRKLYLDLLKEAANGNKKAVISNLRRLKDKLGYEDFDFSKYEVKSDSKDK